MSIKIYGAILALMLYAISGFFFVSLILGLVEIIRGQKRATYFLASIALLGAVIFFGWLGGLFI